MSDYTCNTCDEHIDAKPFMPLRLIGQDGKQKVDMDFTPVYEHMKTQHPEGWTDELAKEYEDWKKERGL